MTRTAWSLPLILLLAVPPAPAADKTKEPPGLKPETVAALAKIRTVVMTPVRIDQIAGKRPDVATHCAELVEARLREAGFEVVPPTVYAETRDRINHDLGGIFDPITGRLKEDRAKALVDYVWRELEAKHPHEAVVSAGVIEHAASFDQFMATWHGIEQSVVGAEGFWARFNSNAGNKYGRMPALSLAYVIRDPDDKSIVAGAGGIELASRIHNVIERLPPESLLNSTEKIDNAARIAFEPLLASAGNIREARGNPPPPEPPKADAAVPADTGAVQ